MAFIWQEEFPGDWAIRPLTAPRVALATRTTPAPTAPVLVHCDSAACKGWHLLAPLDTRIWLNGLPLIGGLRTLTDRDEIRTAAGDTYFFSTEELAQVSALPESGTATMCPRCRQRIESNSQAVRCPQCRIWHHQSTELNCWTYAPTCAMCPQPSALDAGFQWTPMEL